MEGINEIKNVLEVPHHVEKDLNSPIMVDQKAPMEKVEALNETANDVPLPEDELNRPLEVCDETRFDGLSDDQKQEIKDKTGWSDNVVERIKSVQEAQVYIDAGLKEVNGNLERTDIDWDAKIPENKIERMRSLYGDEVADKWAGKTNIDLIREGKAPYGPDGEQINLHHVGQKPDSPLAELCYTEHKQNDVILHDKLKSSEIERPVFRTERKQYWQERYESLISN